MDFAVWKELTYNPLLAKGGRHGKDLDPTP